MVLAALSAPTYLRDSLVVTAQHLMSERGGGGNACVVVSRNSSRPWCFVVVGLLEYIELKW